MPINKNAYKRYRIIDCLLRHNQYPSKKIIMEKLEEEGYPISGATFEKDIETMRSKMELNIIYDRYKNGYAYGSNDIHFDIVFTDEELELIWMAVDHLKPFEASKAVRRIVSSLQMIARRMDIPMEKMKNISGKVDFDLSLIGTGHRKIIAQIFDALFYKQKLIVNSINFRTGEESTTTIIPIKLIESDNEYDWTLDALDENEQKITYKVFKDFHSITNTEERFYENEI